MKNLMHTFSKNFIYPLLLIIFSGCNALAPEVYLYSFFKKNGQDGLHLAYSFDALKWEALKGNQSFITPELGKNKLMRDPCIIEGPDKKFHMVWTIGWGEKSIGYANSTDLIHWSEQKLIPVMEHEADALNCWAPELFYDDTSGQYLIYWSTTIPGRFPKTDLPQDNKNHRMYYVTTNDFESFSDTKLFFDQGFNVIDGTIQKIDSRYYLFLKNETKYPKPEKNIRIATSKNLLGAYSQASEPITDDWVEGPSAIETPEGWIVYYDEYTRENMGAVLSTDLKNWEDISDQISFPEGTRHGTVFKVNRPIFDQLFQYSEQSQSAEK